MQREDIPNQFQIFPQLLGGGQRVKIQISGSDKKVGEIKNHLIAPKNSRICMDFFFLLELRKNKPVQWVGRYGEFCFGMTIRPKTSKSMSSIGWSFDMRL